MLLYFRLVHDNEVVAHFTEHQVLAIAHVHCFDNFLNGVQSEHHTGTRPMIIIEVCSYRKDVPNVFNFLLSM